MLFLHRVVFGFWFFAISAACASEMSDSGAASKEGAHSTASDKLVLIPKYVRYPIGGEAKKYCTRKENRTYVTVKLGGKDKVIEVCKFNVGVRYEKNSKDKFVCEVEMIPTIWARGKYRDESENWKNYALMWVLVPRDPVISAKFNGAQGVKFLDDNNPQIFSKIGSYVHDEKQAYIVGFKNRDLTRRDRQYELNLKITEDSTGIVMSRTCDPIDPVVVNTDTD